MRYRLQRHDGTDCSATMVPFTVLRMVPIQRYRHLLLQINHIKTDYTTFVVLKLVDLLAKKCSNSNFGLI